MSKSHSTLWVLYLVQRKSPLQQGVDFPADMTVRRAQERMLEAARRKGLKITCKSDVAYGTLTYRVTGLCAARRLRLEQSCKATGANAESAANRVIAGSNTASL